MLTTSKIFTFYHGQPTSQPIRCTFQAEDPDTDATAELTLGESLPCSKLQKEHTVGHGS